MSMAILLPIATYPDATSEVGLGNALRISARLGARVVAIVQEVDIAPIHSALGEALLGLSKMALEAEGRSRERGRDIAQWVTNQGQSLGIEIEASALRCRPEAFGERLISHSRCLDMAIAVQDDADPQRRAETEALIFGSGGPVLVVPRETPIPVAEERAIPLNVTLAWDGSRAASRALRDAMAILPVADLVSIITVGDDKSIDPQSVTWLQALLDRHGLRHNHLQRERGSAPIGDTLQAIAISQNSDLLVMGAYGRNRLQEFVLGGATRTVLHAPRLPILMSH